MKSTITFADLNSINNIISNLYDESIPVQNRLTDFLNHLVSVVQFDKSCIFFFLKDEDNGYIEHSDISVHLDNDPKNKNYVECDLHTREIYPYVDRQSRILFKGSEFFSMKKRTNDESGNSEYLPRYFTYSIDGNLQMNSNIGLKAGICLFRGPERIDFSEKDLEIVSLLQPHLSNILNYYEEVDDSPNSEYMIEKCTYIGIAVIDENYQITKSNAQFQNVLSFPDIGEKISEKVIEMCKNVKSKSGRLKDFSAEYKFKDYPFFIEVSTTSGGREDSPIQYCCLVYDFSCFFDYATDQISDKHKLTPREINLLNAVICGKSNEEIAAELYLSIPTIKKYLASIYGKLGIKNQKQILELLKIH